MPRPVHVFLSLPVFFFFWQFYWARVLGVAVSGERGALEEVVVGGSLLNIKWRLYNLISFPFMHFANARGRSRCLCASAVDKLWGKLRFLSGIKHVFSCRVGLGMEKGDRKALQRTFLPIKFSKRGCTKVQAPMLRCSSWLQT